MTTFAPDDLSDEACRADVLNNRAQCRAYAARVLKEYPIGSKVKARKTYNSPLVDGVVVAVRTFDDRGTFEAQFGLPAEHPPLYPVWVPVGKKTRYNLQYVD